MGPKLRTEHKMMWSKAVLDKLLPLECTRRSVCRYTLILHKEELEEVMDAIATHEKLAPLGKVELRVSVQLYSTPEQ